MIQFVFGGILAAMAIITLPALLTMLSGILAIVLAWLSMRWLYSDNHNNDDTR